MTNKKKHRGMKKRRRNRILISVSVLAVFALLIIRALLFPEISRNRDEGTEVASESESQKIDTESEIETETETETEPQPEIKTVTISATGDCCLGPTHRSGYAGTFNEYYDNYGAGYFFENVKDIFAEDDFTVVDLECALTNEEVHEDKEWALKGRPEYAEVLKLGNIDGVVMANNHTLDYLEKGLQDTKDAVTNAGIPYAYYGESPIYTTENGITIGWVSSSFLNYAEFREEYMRQGIEELKEKGVDIIVAFPHWGIERTYYPETYQENMGHKIIDWGADVVVACHPHVIQGAEVYKGKVIMYSMGNFCFGGNKNPPDKNSFIFQQTFTFVDGVKQENVEARIIPCTISSVTSHNDCKPTVAEGEKKAEIIGLMNQYSEAYTNTSFDQEGKLIYSGE